MLNPVDNIVNKNKNHPLTLYIASTVGTFVEFYDLIIFAVMTPILSPLFFQSETLLTSHLKGYATFAMGYLIRPLGALYFGRLGDRVGRAAALQRALILMGGASLGIACLPTTQHIGIMAPALLLFLRLVQGFSAGGEYSGGALFLIENTSPHRAYRSGALVCMTVLLSVSVSSQVAKFFSSSQMPPYAWRIPFFIGFGAALLGAWIRRRFPQNEPSKSSQPALLSAVDKRHILSLILISGLGVMLYYTFTTYLVSFLMRHSGWDKGQAYGLTTVISLSTFCLMYIGASLADRFSMGPRIMEYSALLIACMAPLLFWGFTTPSNSLFFTASLTGTVLLFAFYGGLNNTYSSSLFEKATRYRGMALSYSLGASLIGGTAPLTYTYLESQFPHPLIPSLWLSAMAFICWIALNQLNAKKQKTNP